MRYEVETEEFPDQAVRAQRNPVSGGKLCTSHASKGEYAEGNKRPSCLKHSERERLTNTQDCALSLHRSAMVYLGPNSHAYMHIHISHANTHTHTHQLVFSELGK